MRSARRRSISGSSFAPLPPVDEAAPPLQISPNDPMAQHFSPIHSGPTPPPSRGPSRSSSLVDLDSVRRISSGSELESTVRRSNSWFDRWGAKARDLVAAEGSNSWALPRTDEPSDASSSEDEDDRIQPLVVRPRQRRQISDEVSSGGSSVPTPESPRSIRHSPAQSSTRLPTTEDDEEEDIATMMAACKPSPLSRFLSLALPDLGDYTRGDDLTPRGEDNAHSWLRGPVTT